MYYCSCFNEKTTLRLLLFVRTKFCSLTTPHILWVLIIGEKNPPLISQTLYPSSHAHKKIILTSHNDNNNNIIHYKES